MIGSILEWLTSADAWSGADGILARLLEHVGYTLLVLVIAAAIAIADTESMQAVSMRRLAAALEIPTMAVYRYVPSSDELQAAMLDRVLADLPIPPRTTDWRADVEALLALSGIGDYTARAVACFAYRRRVPVVDTNVRRVVARVVHGRADSPASVRDLADVEALCRAEDRGVGVDGGPV